MITRASFLKQVTGLMALAAAAPKVLGAKPTVPVRQDPPPDVYRGEFKVLARAQWAEAEMQRLAFKYDLQWINEYHPADNPLRLNGRFCRLGSAPIYERNDKVEWVITPARAPLLLRVCLSDIRFSYNVDLVEQELLAKGARQ